MSRRTVRAHELYERAKKLGVARPSTLSKEQLSAAKDFIDRLGGNRRRAGPQPDSQDEHRVGQSCITARSVSRYG